MSLMVSISGIRGIVGTSLTPEVIVKYAAAFAEYCGHGKIIIGRDGRSTGNIIGNIVSSTLLSMGCEVIALGVTPTPTIAIAVEQLQAAGGIAITASHNPMEWNGLKFMSPTGMFLNAAENKRFWDIAAKGTFSYAPWDGIGRHLRDGSYLAQHTDMVLHLPFVHIDDIKKRKFKVVVDCINSAGGMIVPQMLRSMGCDVVELNCDASGIFTRPAEPIPENLGEVCRAVLRENADLGVVVDPDVDRLVLITEKGEPFGEEYTITTVVKFVLEHLPVQNITPSVVVNLSTTRAIDDIAAQYGATVVRTPVGEINVAQRMKDIGAVVGGEGSGGVILPAVHYGRDAIIGIGIVMQQLTEFNGTLSALRAALPAYEIVKSKVAVSGRAPDEILAEVRTAQDANADINTDDGLKISFKKSWVHLRKSNTEPIIRIIAEAPSETEARALVTKFQAQIQKLNNA